MISENVAIIAIHVESNEDRVTHRLPRSLTDSHSLKDLLTTN